ncbi:arsenosugar biosynthesis radical SAM (seleno)protein ArsS [Hyalangium gracile]|uniref:arsenosugar biosynthesis radical SAM (seleno)protein ArsS n=1 Tax=Hyalangium gracile TaxID=394092 RepID=UPI001CCF26E7|nr:arsenosugar biosynthesis radical SAM (seleno)protein ArsS [Hyalangium gracile]
MATNTPPSLLSRRAPLASPATQLETLHRLKLPREFDDALREAGLHPLRPMRLDILQMNLGKMCNQTCRHCHVDAGPDRREVMSRETMEQCLAALAKTAIPTVDLTGGAPEMNPHFRWLVEEARKLGRHVMDRCNLTILETAPHADLPEFLARHRVEVVCSLPHYRALNTDKQRGEGVYEKSIRALKRLNALGYGDGQSGLRLVLVTNPVGAYLPAGQASLEAEWKRELLRNHGVRFDALFTITNMPISRFLEWLEQSGNLAAYLERLVTAFNPAAAPGVMCRNTLSVGWDGQLYDCDFNQMLDLPVEAGAPRHIRDFDLAKLEARSIVTERHCFGCTAGAGSSCGGATT